MIVVYDSMCIAHRARRNAASKPQAAVEVPAPVKQHSFYVSLGHAARQQKLSSYPDLVHSELIVQPVFLSGGVLFSRTQVPLLLPQMKPLMLVGEDDSTPTPSESTARLVAIPSMQGISLYTWGCPYIIRHFLIS